MVIKKYNNNNKERRWKHRQFLLRKRAKLYRRKTQIRKKGQFLAKHSPYRKKLKAPTCLDLTNKETRIFLNDIRQCADDPLCSLKIDFTGIDFITPGCALVFTSELDRLRRIRGKNGKLHVVDFKNWKEEIKYLLYDMGMFDLLNIQNIPAEFGKEPRKKDVIFLKFMSGNLVNPDDVLTFRDTLSNLIDVLPNKKKLKIALDEAMDNVLSHGYPDNFIMSSPLKQKMWWMSASINRNTSTLNVMFFDQGIGIPKSLPKTRPNLLTKLLGMSDAAKIREATHAGISQTNQKNRGNGLPLIIDYVTSLKKSAFVRIISDKGEYIRGNGIQEQLNDKIHSINGTLIEWQVNI